MTTQCWMSITDHCISIYLLPFVLCWRGEQCQQRHLSEVSNVIYQMHWTCMVHWMEGTGPFFLKVPGRFSPLFKKIYIIIIILGAAAGWSDPEVQMGLMSPRSAGWGQAMTMQREPRGFISSSVLLGTEGRGTFTPYPSVTERRRRCLLPLPQLDSRGWEGCLG